MLVLDFFLHVLCSSKCFGAGQCECRGGVRGRPSVRLRQSDRVTDKDRKRKKKMEEERERERCCDALEKFFLCFAF